MRQILYMMCLFVAVLVLSIILHICINGLNSSAQKESTNWRSIPFEHSRRPQQTTLEDYNSIYNQPDTDWAIEPNAPDMAITWNSQIVDLCPHANGTVIMVCRDCDVNDAPKIIYNAFVELANSIKTTKQRSWRLPRMEETTQ